MFINRPHSSWGGAAESKPGSGSERRLPPFRPENKRHKWTVAFWSQRGFAVCAETAVVKLHEAPPSGSLGSRKCPASLCEGGTAPRPDTLGCQAGNLSRSSSARCQRSSGTWLRAAGWERLTAVESAPEHSPQGTQRPRTEPFTLSHQPHHAQGESSCSGCLLHFLAEICTRPQLVSWDLTVRILGQDAFPKHLESTGQTLNLIIFGNKKFFYVWIGLFSSCLFLKKSIKRY